MSCAIAFDYIVKYFLEDDQSLLMRYSREKWVTGKPRWHNARWAKFLRWLNSKILLPEPLRILVGMEWWQQEYQVEEWPEDLLDRIKIQMAFLEERGQRPTMICCGPVGADSVQMEMTRAYSYMMHYTPASSYGPEWKVFGLPCRVIPWMKRDEVMVV